ncbi:S-adenosyl-L-methionine-dependent methyltransferase [Hyaloscypha variabilis]
MNEFRSSTTSLRSSMYETVEENGRTYHKYKEGSYLLPNDENEMSRLDLQHHLCKLTLHGKSHLAPLKNPKNVLDFGTGTGIWAIEFAEEFPEASVLGTDLSPIQPVFVPPNCRFEVDDAEDDWLYEEKFDYIHGRLLAMCFKDPLSIFRKAFNSLNPGGYFEMFDFDAKYRCIDDSDVGSSLREYSDMMISGAAKLGKVITHAPNYKRYFEEAGFMDIVEEKFQWPSNTWPKGKYHKTLGLWYNKDMQDGLEGMTMAVFTRAHGMKKEEVQEIVTQIKKDVNDKSIHVYVPIHVVYGRKPE